MLSGVHAEQKHKQKQQKLQEIYLGDNILNVFFFILKKGIKWSLSQRVASMPQIMKTSVHLTFRSFFLKRQSRDNILFSTHHLRSVNLVCTSLQMPMDYTAKPIVQGSTDNIVGSWNYRSIPVYYVQCTLCHSSVDTLCVALC